MAKIPQFESLEEAAEFWDTHDFEDYVDDTVPVVLTVKAPQRPKRLQLSLDLKTYQRIEALARKRRLDVENLVSDWLKEKAFGGKPIEVAPTARRATAKNGRQRRLDPTRK